MAEQLNEAIAAFIANNSVHIRNQILNGSAEQFIDERINASGIRDLNTALKAQVDGFNYRLNQAYDDNRKLQEEIQGLKAQKQQYEMQNFNHHKAVLNLEKFTGEKNSKTYTEWTDELKSTLSGIRTGTSKILKWIEKRNPELDDIKEEDYAYEDPDIEK